MAYPVGRLVCLGSHVAGYTDRLPLFMKSLVEGGAKRAKHVVLMERRTRRASVTFRPVNNRRSASLASLSNRVVRASFSESESFLAYGTLVSPNAFILL